MKLPRLSSLLSGHEQHQSVAAFTNSSPTQPPKNEAIGQEEEDEKKKSSAPATSMQVAPHTGCGAVLEKTEAAPMANKSRRRGTNLSDSGAESVFYRPCSDQQTKKKDYIKKGNLPATEASAASLTALMQAA